MEMYEYENHFKNNISDEMLRRFYIEIENKFVLPRLVYPITSRCSLNCENCINLIPYYQKRNDIDVGAFVSDTNRILELVDEIIFFELGGGEPLLHCDLITILDFLSGIEKIRNVIIISNGIVNINDNVLTKLKNDKFIVRFSDYGLSNRLYMLRERLNTLGVRSETYENMSWYSPGKPVKKEKSVKALMQQYRTCHASQLCKTLKNGKMYSCNRSMALHEIGILDSPLDYIDIYNNNRIDLYNFYDRKYCNACDYCELYSTEMKSCIAGGQVEKR